MSMRRAVIITNYFLVHKIQVKNLILSSTQVLLKCNEVYGITPNRKSTQLTTRLMHTIILI